MFCRNDLRSIKQNRESLNTLELGLRVGRDLELTGLVVRNEPLLSRLDFVDRREVNVITIDPSGKEQAGG